MTGYHVNNLDVAFGNIKQRRRRRDRTEVTSAFAVKCLAKRETGSNTGLWGVRF